MEKEINTTPPSGGNVKKKGNNPVPWRTYKQWIFDANDDHVFWPEGIEWSAGGAQRIVAAVNGMGLELKAALHSAEEKNKYFIRQDHSSHCICAERFCAAEDRIKELGKDGPLVCQDRENDDLKKKLSLAEEQLDQEKQKYANALNVIESLLGRI